MTTNRIVRVVAISASFGRSSGSTVVRNVAVIRPGLHRGRNDDGHRVHVLHELNDVLSNNKNAGKQNEARRRNVTPQQGQ